MSGVRDYICKQWRGENEIIKSFVLNGIMIPYLIFFVACSLFFGAAFTHGGDAYWILVSGAEILVLIWAVVGIVRCGIRDAYKSGNTPGLCGGLIATLVCAGFVVLELLFVFVILINFIVDVSHKA